MRLVELKGGRSTFGGRRAAVSFVALICAAACATGAGESGEPSKADPPDGAEADGAPPTVDAGVEGGLDGSGRSDAPDDGSRDATGDADAANGGDGSDATDGGGEADARADGDAGDATSADADAGESKDGEARDAAGDGAASTCGACTGCCDPLHPICRGGNTASSCGTQGMVCLDCTLAGQKCVSGACQ